MFQAARLLLSAPLNAVDLCMSSDNPKSEIRNPKSTRPIARWLAMLRAAVAVVAALILSANAAAEEARHPDAVSVFHCTFGDDWDVNYDTWPDRWVRKTGLGYPHYVNIAIQEDATAVGKKCLRIDLDGASAEVASPPIRVMPRFSYVFEAQLKNTGLKYSTAVITLDFCDSNGRVLQTEKTEPLSVTDGWQAIRLGPVEPRDPGNQPGRDRAASAAEQQGGFAGARVTGRCVVGTTAEDRRFHQQFVQRIYRAERGRGAMRAVGHSGTKPRD